MHRLRWAFLTVMVLAAVIVIAPRAIAARFAPIGPAVSDRLWQQPPPVTNDTCIACHTNPSLQKKLYNGEMWSLSIDPKDHARLGSRSGRSGLCPVPYQLR